LGQKEGKATYEVRFKKKRLGADNLFGFVSKGETYHTYTVFFFWYGRGEEELNNYPADQGAQINKFTLSWAHEIK